MPVSIHSTSVGVMTRMLENLSAMLDAAVTHAEANAIDPATLLEGRLAPDMHTLVGQVQFASDAAKFAGARLAGMEPPAFPDTETTFPELQARISKTVRFLKVLEPLAIEAAASRIVTVTTGETRLSFRGPDYLRQFALPNFFFHITTAYAILRSKGVPLGKLDYLGAFESLDATDPLREKQLQYG